MTQSLIGTWGWMNALLILAVVMPFLLMLVFPMRVRAASAQPVADPGSSMPMSAAIAEAFSHKGFWLLNIGFLACGFQLTFAATYLPSYLADNGMSASDGVAALALIALMNVVGTYLFGLWGGRMSRKHLLAAIYLARSIAIGLFTTVPLSTPSVFVFSAVLGFLFLGPVPLTNGLTAQIFGLRYIATLFGFLFFSHQLGSFFGVWVGGYVFNAIGSYQAGWMISIALGILAAIVHLPINDRPVSRTPRRAVAS